MQSPDKQHLEPIAQGKSMGFVDAACANDLQKGRLTTGHAFTFLGGAMVHRSKTQSLTALSSTEAEFIAAGTAAKDRETHLINLARAGV